jgi:hypothetical protein
MVPGRRRPDPSNDERWLEDPCVVPDAAPADLAAALRAPAGPAPPAAGVGGEPFVPRGRP